METNPIEYDIPGPMIEKWQKVIDLLARTLEVPAGLIMKVHSEEIEVFLKSDTLGNPYESGEKARLDTGLYCETVMATRRCLLVPDALKDPAWDHNPDIELDMTFYMGFPLYWPDGRIFGTICVLDAKENDKALAYQDVMAEFQKIVLSDMKLLCLDREIMAYSRQLEEFNKVLVERETRIIEIKEEMNALCRQFGTQPLYPEIWEK